MNKPNYSPEGIELRVASMEECCAEQIDTDSALPMTATIIPEVRYLLNKLNGRWKAKGFKPESAVKERVEEIELQLLDLEKKRGAIRAGKFIRISASIISEMRYLLDALGVEHSESAGSEDDLWEDEVHETEMAEVAE